MPRTLPDMKIIVASRAYLSKIRASLATWITVDEPGLVEMYEVLILSAASRCVVAENISRKIAASAWRSHFIGCLQTVRLGRLGMSLYHFHSTRKSLIDRAGRGVYLSSKCRKNSVGASAC